MTTLFNILKFLLAVLYFPDAYSCPWKEIIYRKATCILLDHQGLFQCIHSTFHLIKCFLGSQGEVILPHFPFLPPFLLHSFFFSFLPFFLSFIHWLTHWRSLIWIFFECLIRHFTECLICNCASYKKKTKITIHLQSL